MIKLNNKNITYVALADTNNSLKAPKEIWYADSANSVKLVYRRKDALIEGEDYEKYHLLNGYTDEGAALLAQGADINVGSISLDNKVFTIELGQVSRNVVIYGTSPYFIPMWCMYVNNMYVMQVQERKGNDNTIHNMTYNWTTSNTITLDFINNVATLGNSTFQIEGTGYTFRGFNSAMWQNPRTVGRIKISDELHLIPCKLLKPVPKWLDANGIRRQVGECGMIDLVSGKFYGNVNSVGTFTVENYYERKEWLQGDGSAYIDTNVTSFSGVICIKFKKSVMDGTRLFGRERRNPNIDDYSDRCVFQYSPSGGYVNIYGVNNVRLNSDIENEVLIDITNDIAYGIDGATASGFSITPNLDALSLYLFADHRKDGATDFSSDYISKFSITNSINLIPCTLSIDLPASMDANNIARTKGTSGMWDLVSDRFYGNVANSGTFKAVNLAEGVDYEVHDWLVGDGSAYIDTLVSDLTNVKNIHCTIKRPSDVSGISNKRVFGRENSSGYSGTRFVVRPYDNHLDLFTSTASYTLSTDNDDYINIDAESNTASTSQQSKTIEDIKTNGISLCLFGDHTSLSNFSAFYKGSIGEFTIDETINLIPVKLLRSIPSKYDANGIARQAGECGMYDTVNDVFYGNIASSGTFSVEDDS